MWKNKLDLVYIMIVWNLKSATDFVCCWEWLSSYSLRYELGVVLVGIWNV